MPQQSRLIFWLLLAATLCVNCATTVWMFQMRLRDPTPTFFLALAYGQVNILCAWAVLFTPRISFRWVAPFAAGALVGLLLAIGERTTPSILTNEMLTYTGLIWAQIALTLPVLWPLKTMRPFVLHAEGKQQPRWQFGTKHLLTLMTCLAALLAVLGRSKELSNHASAITGLVIVNELLLLSTIVAVSKSNLHVLLRLAFSLAAALAIAIPCEWFQIALADDLDMFTFNLIQAAIMWAWLEVLQPRHEEQAQA
jgi:hypothetical protein